jgi:hypothetical protein
MTKVLVFLFMVGMVFLMAMAIVAPTQPLQIRVIEPDGTARIVELASVEQFQIED